ncbi:MAG: hypothetical protein ACP5U2_14435, partial [Bryobacteraceae bacterium]
MRSLFLVHAEPDATAAREPAEFLRAEVPDLEVLVEEDPLAPGQPRWRKLREASWPTRRRRLCAGRRLLIVLDGLEREEQW